MIYVFILFVIFLFLIIFIKNEQNHRKIVLNDLQKTYMYKTFIVRKMVKDMPNEYKCLKQIVSNLSKQAEKKSSEEFVSYLVNNTKKVDNNTKEKLFSEIKSILETSDENLEMIVVWYITTSILINDLQEKQQVLNVERQLEEIEKITSNKEYFNDFCMA